MLRARLVRLVQAAKLEKVEGVVKALKESFGFIERADMVQDVSGHECSFCRLQDFKLALAC